MQIGFTLCFIRHRDKYLMIFRNKPPHQYKWNGVGGKKGPNESPESACLREIQEETGLILDKVDFRGIVTWNNVGGMYVFIAESDTNQVISMEEGKLEWKELDWILSSPEVVSNIPIFLPPMLDKEQEPMQFSFMYNEGNEEEILEYTVKKI